MFLVAILSATFVCVFSGVGGQKGMPSVAGDHSHVPVGQSVQRDVTAPRPRHGGMSVEDPRLSGSTHRAVAALLPPGNVVAGNRRRRRRRLHRACSGRRRGQTGFFQLLRAGDRARDGDGDDGGGNPQHYDVRGSAARTAARPVHVRLARDQRADRRTNDAENPRTIHRQLPRLLTTSALVHAVVATEIRRPFDCLSKVIKVTV